MRDVQRRAGVSIVVYLVALLLCASYAVVRAEQTPAPSDYIVEKYVVPPFDPFKPYPATVGQQSSSSFTAAQQAASAELQEWADGINGYPIHQAWSAYTSQVVVKAQEDSLRARMGLAGPAQYIARPAPPHP